MYGNSVIHLVFLYKNLIYLFLKAICPYKDMSWINVRPPVTKEIGEINRLVV